MKTLVIAATLVSTFAASSAFALEPIKGSLIYNGQPAAKLTASPVGSSFTNTFTDDSGRQYEETYVITDNHDLKLVDRHALGND